MDPSFIQPETEVLTCEVCRKEVPFSAAVTSEIEDYVANFCGLDCYEQWKKDSPTPPC